MGRKRNGLCIGLIPRTSWSWAGPRGRSTGARPLGRSPGRCHTATTIGSRPWPAPGRGCWHSRARTRGLSGICHPSLLTSLYWLQIAASPAQLRPLTDACVRDTEASGGWLRARVRLEHARPGDEHGQLSDLLLHLLTHSLFPTELTVLSANMQDSRPTRKTR